MVENNSNGAARLFIAKDEEPMGDPVGTARPATVAPRTTTEVTFTVPPGRGWAILVNPGPKVGPLILAQDVPTGSAGRLPLTILVGPDGNPGVNAPDDPGWFGH